MNVYEIITDRIIKLIEENNALPWRMPWADMRPRNLISKKPYRGVNVFLLGCAPYSSPWWVTYKQAQQLNGYVKRGEKSLPVVFWRWVETQERNDKGLMEVKPIPLLRYFNVFNAVGQCAGLEDKIPDEKRELQNVEPINRSKEIVANMPNPPTIKYKEPRAYYRPSQDLINLPLPELFDQPEEFASALFHEAIHATGSSKRLNRLGVAEKALYGSYDYSKEELIAEMGAAFLCGHCGIENTTIKNSAAYLKGWLEKIKTGDKRLLVHAASAAQRASDYILRQLPSSEEKEEVQ